MVVLAESHSLLFGFCSQQCAWRFLRGLGPIVAQLEPKAFMCWLCGADLAEGVNWLEETK